MITMVVCIQVKVHHYQPHNLGTSELNVNNQKNNESKTTNMLYYNEHIKTIVLMHTSYFYVVTIKA